VDGGGRPIRSVRRHRPTSRWVITLLRPLFRYSLTVDAYVLRIGGARWGPILEPKERDSPSTDVLVPERQIDEEILGNVSADTAAGFH